MAAVAAVKPKVEVHAHHRAAPRTCPTATRTGPGDIWGSLDGKTVEIVNTDAEGRLVLADALAYARALSPGPHRRQRDAHGRVRRRPRHHVLAACTRTDEDAAREFAAALKDSGEPMWRMPLLEDLREQIKSDVADVKQTGDRWGGSITAALFLREFVGDTTLGPLRHRRARRRSTAPAAWTQAKGATGHGVLTFLALIERARAERATRRAYEDVALEQTTLEQKLARRWRARSPTSR